MSTHVTRAEICVMACAEFFRNDGEIVVSPMGTIPRIGALLARSTFAPDLILTDGAARILADPAPLGKEDDVPVEGWLPFRGMFELLNSGKRHVMMGASQIDAHANQNISCIGDFARPKVQLLGSRGAPGNTVNHATSYWVAKHGTRVFVPEVDFVSGVGTDRAAAAGSAASEYHDLRGVVSDLAVLDLGGPRGTLRIVSVHPGVSVDDVQAATGFELAMADDVHETPAPDAESLRLIREVLDPGGAREREVPDPAASNT